MRNNWPGNQRAARPLQRTVEFSTKIFLPYCRKRAECEQETGMLNRGKCSLCSLLKRHAFRDSCMEMLLLLFSPLNILNQNVVQDDCYIYHVLCSVYLFAIEFRTVYCFVVFVFVNTFSFKIKRREKERKTLGWCWLTCILLFDNEIRWWVPWQKLLSQTETLNFYCLDAFQESWSTWNLCTSPYPFSPQWGTQSDLQQYSPLLFFILTMTLWECN